MVEYIRQPQVNVAFPLTHTYTLTYTREKHCRQLLHLDHPFLTLPASGRFWELRRINQTWQCVSSHLGVCFENNIANGHVLDLFSTETLEIYQAISDFLIHFLRTFKISEILDSRDNKLCMCLCVRDEEKRITF